MQLHTIAKIHNDFMQKFGIPRQSGLTPHMKSRVIFEPEFANVDALRGIEGFSHLWLIWQFDQALRRDSSTPKASTEAAEGAEANAGSKVMAEMHTSETASETTIKKSASQTLATKHDSWHPTVRPPRLGGNERVGVFATRSPYRPNSLGLSVVTLELVEWHTSQGPILHVNGADIMNGTPIFDIKPYLPYADAYPSARDGFVSISVNNANNPDCANSTSNANIESKDSSTNNQQNNNQQVKLNVVIPQELSSKIPNERTRALTEVLACDPRPAYHNDPERIYFMKFANLDISFKVENNTLRVTNIKDL